MKKITLLFLTAAAFIFNSCGNDDDGETILPAENTAPVATDISVSVNEDETTTLTINPTDEEDEIEDLTITIDALPEVGDLIYNDASVSVGDTFTVTEFNTIILEVFDIEEDTTTTIEYTVTDSEDATDTGIITIEVIAFVDPIIGTWFLYSDNGELEGDCESQSNLIFQEDGTLIIENYYEDYVNVECIADDISSNNTWENIGNDSYLLTPEDDEALNFEALFSDDFQTLTISFDSEEIDDNGENLTEVLVYKK